jgi:hypothetical protein
MPVIEPEDGPRKKALFTARGDPSVVEQLLRYASATRSSRLGSNSIRSVV